MTTEILITALTAFLQAITALIAWFLARQAANVTSSAENGRASVVVSAHGPIPVQPPPTGGAVTAPATTPSGP